MNKGVCMAYFDGKFHKREKKLRRNYAIEDQLYSELEELSKLYDASTNELINASLCLLIETEDIALYKKEDDEIAVTHTLLIYESTLSGLENLKSKYGVSIYKLVNIAIKNALHEYK